MTEPPILAKVRTRSSSSVRSWLARGLLLRRRRSLSSKAFQEREGRSPNSFRYSAKGVAIEGWQAGQLTSTAME